MPALARAARSSSFAGSLRVAVHLDDSSEACSHQCPTAGAAHAAVFEQLDKDTPASPIRYEQDDGVHHLKESPSGMAVLAAADPDATLELDLEASADGTTLGLAIKKVAEDRKRALDCLIPGVTQRASSTPSCGSHSSLHPNAMLLSSAHRTSVRVRC